MERVNQANKLVISDPSGSISTATEALSLAIANGDKTAEYQSYNTLGTLMFNNGDYVRAADYFSKATAGFESIGDQKSLAYSRKYLSLSLEKQKKYDKAVNVEAQQIKANASYKNAEYYTAAKRSATLKGKAGKKREAIQELEALKEDANISPAEKLDIYAELGDLYLEMKDTVTAIRLLNSATAAGLTYASPQADVYFKSINEKNLSKGLYDANLQSQTQLYRTAVLRNDPRLLQTANFNLGSTYMAKGEYQTAVSYLDQSLKLSKTTGQIQEQEKSIRELSKAYEKMGQYDKALATYKMYVTLVDSFRKLQLNDEIERQVLNKKYSIQADRIKLLEEQQKDRENRLSRQRRTIWWLGAGLLILASLIYGLWWNIRQKQKANLLIRLQGLRTQMNPHFIFNSLNSVNNFIARNDEKSANKYLSEFSKLMRAVLKNSDMNFISLTTELQTLELYLSLEHFRFGDKFDFTLHVDDDLDTEKVMVPPMLVQPYIENAIWHGLRYKEEKGMLNVRFFKENGQLICTVHDNGIGRKKSAALKTEHQKGYQSTGIKNTRERIEILNRLHKTALDIRITDLELNGEAAGTLVRISLPFVHHTENAA